MRRLFGTRRGVFFKSSGSLPAPVISNIAVVDHGTYFVVTWTTDVASTSQVFYGLTSSYGSSTTKDNTLVTSHSVQVGNVGDLSYATLYHFKVESTKSGRPNVDSADQTTTTLAFPAGDLGALHISNGQTVAVDPGTTWDYNTIAIDAGGTLNVNGTSNPVPPIFGYKTSCAINGTINANGNFPGGTDTYSITSPNGIVLSYTLTVNGGGGGGSSNGGIGGQGGDGGGGAGYYGGSGQDGNSFDFSSPTGGGQGGPGADGGSGGDGLNNDMGDATGGGGGGGYGGLAGGSIAFIGNGNISGSGVINVSGDSGTSGGSGGGGADFFAAYGGGGGGGGGGGSGGTVFQRRHGGSAYFGGAINLDGGGAGGGGSGGIATGSITVVNGSSGGGGSAGDIGAQDNATF